VAAVYWLAWRRLRVQVSLGRFMGLYAATFLVFGFLARFFVDNYVAALLSFALCILPLGAAPLRSGLDAVDGDGAALINAA
jgi:hypothetical protein